MGLLPDTDRLVDSAVTGWDLLVGDGIADRRPTPSSIVLEERHCTVRRFRSRRNARTDLAPILMVPPLAAPATCFDLHRGASLAQHFTAMGYPTYLVDYGPISFGDRALGIEYWVEHVIPQAIRTVSELEGDRPVQPIGWCLGGIMTTLAVAADQDLPVASLSLVASPFDFEEMRLLAPLRQAGRLTGGRLVSALYKSMGGAPAPLVSRAFQLTAIDRMVTKPWFLLTHLDDRETIAHTEAVDAYMAHMAAYPGRTFGQLYHAFFRVNSLKHEGTINLGEREIDLRDLRQPVISISGSSDILAPEKAVTALGGMLPNSPEVRIERAPGGHLGVLTGRSAKDTTWEMLDGWLAEHDPVRNAQPAASA